MDSSNFRQHRFSALAASRRQVLKLMAGATALSLIPWKPLAPVRAAPQAALQQQSCDLIRQQIGEISAEIDAIERGSFFDRLIGRGQEMRLKQQLAQKQIELATCELGAQSVLLKSVTQSFCGNQVPGCVFYVTRNGLPFADGSFGWARLPSAPDGQRIMDIDTLIHIASISKFFCAAAILRMIQEWNSAITNAARDGNGRLYVPNAPAEDVHLYATALGRTYPLATSAEMYPLVEPILDQSLIQSYASYPGQNVRGISLRQLLTHTSGLPTDGYQESDLGGLSKQLVEWEPWGPGASRFMPSKVVTAYLKRDAAAGAANAPRQYSNSAFSVLSGIIEAVTGQLYTRWVRSRFFSDPGFADIDRKAIDPARAASYYQSTSPGAFSAGVHHPDYTHFSGAGGWYVSARHFCNWLDALMQKTPVQGAPMLDDPDLLLSELLGLDNSYTLGNWSGAMKNGSTGVGGGTTFCRFAYLHNAQGDRVCALVGVNGNLANADDLLVRGLQALEPML